MQYIKEVAFFTLSLVSCTGYCAISGQEDYYFVNKTTYTDNQNFVCSDLSSLQKNMPASSGMASGSGFLCINPNIKNSQDVYGNPVVIGWIKLIFPNSNRTAPNGNPFNGIAYQVAINCQNFQSANVSQIFYLNNKVSDPVNYNTSPSTWSFQQDTSGGLGYFTDNVFCTPEILNVKAFVVSAPQTPSTE